jgi:hypothetical protein
MKHVPQRRQREMLTPHASRSNHVMAVEVHTGQVSVGASKIA